MKQFLSVVSFLFIIEGIDAVETTKSVIILSSPNLTESNYMLKYVDEALELNCLYTGDKNRSVGWVLSKTAYKRVFTTLGHNGSSKVTIDHITETDTGTYRCGLHLGDAVGSCILNTNCSSHIDLSSSAVVHLIVKKKSCLGFQCSPTVCISDRYVCDGLKDCNNNEDEHQDLCGQDPCHSKIKCPNGRCIPQEWCCINRSNCTQKWDVNCCPNNVNSQLSDGRSLKYLGSYQHYNDHLRELYKTSNATIFHKDISFLQTLTHTVIGCALVFVVIGPILAIAICRVYMRQRSYRRCYQNTFSQIPRISSRCPQPTGLSSVTYQSPTINQVSTREDYDSFLFSESDGQRCNSNGDILYRNLDHFQLRDPPPYYEVISPRPDDDPPPPYVSPSDPSNVSCP